MSSDEDCAAGLESKSKKVKALARCGALGIIAGLVLLGPWPAFAHANKRARLEQSTAVTCPRRARRKPRCR